MTVNFITAQVRDFVIRSFRTRRRERLIRNYFFVSVILIASALISAGLLEIYFRYREGLEQISLMQQDAAAGAALRIERFVQDIATMMKAVTKSPDIRSSKKRIDYEFELKRLFFLAPAISEALVLDTEGAHTGASVPFSRCLSFPQEKSFAISCLPAIKSGQILFRDRLFPR